MAGSVLDVFNLLGELSNDGVFATQVRTRAEEVLKGKPEGRDARLVRLYLQVEQEFMRHSKGRIRTQDLRRQAMPILARAEPGYEGFRLLFLPDEIQLVALASALIAAYMDHGRSFFGPRVASRMIAVSLAETPWKGIRIAYDGGIVYEAMRMHSVSECEKNIGALFGGWYEMTRALLGENAARRVFELAYRDVEQAYGFLPLMSNLLGQMPSGALLTEKTERLHQLESETQTQGREIQAADADLARQAERLQQTVIELEATRRQLEAVGKAHSEFIEVVSHQFRTPLSTIRWNGELLADALGEQKIDAQYKDAIETVCQRSVYLIETLDRVFATLDIETGKVVIDAKPAFLWEIVQDVYGRYEKDIARRGLKWKFHRSKDQLRQIPMDKVKIASALNILIGNAIVYDKEGGKIEVTLSDETIDGKEYQVCSISDDGIGLAKEDQARLFEKFFRSQPAVLKAADGTGLGMFIVKNFIDAHHGKVWIESQGEGKGMTVSIGLPVK